MEGIVDYVFYILLSRQIIIFIAQNNKYNFIILYRNDNKNQIKIKSFSEKKHENVKLKDIIMIYN